MIRIVAVLNPEGQLVPLEQVLARQPLVDWLNRIARGDLAVVGRPSLSVLSEGLPQLRILTRDQSYRHALAKVEHQVEPLIAQYVGSSDELVVVGGASLFTQFLPHSAVLDLAIVPGEAGKVSFNDWNDGSFDLVDSRSREGFETRKLFRL